MFLLFSYGFASVSFKNDDIRGTVSEFFKKRPRGFNTDDFLRGIADLFV